MGGLAKFFQIDQNHPTNENSTGSGKIGGSPAIVWEKHDLLFIEMP